MAVTTSEHPGLVSAISLVSSSEHLDCITKQRAKGPTGRRLPRNVKSRLVFPLTDAVHQQQQQRSESLPRLEQSDPVNNIRSGPVKNPTLPCSSRLIDRMKEFETVQQPVVVVEPVATLPDHSGFDQSWFLDPSNRVSTPSSPEVVASQPERSNPPPKSPASPTRPALTNRSWSCNFL